MKIMYEYQWNKNRNAILNKNIKLIKHDKVKFQSFQEEMNNTMEMQRFGGRKDENNSLKYLTLPFGINLLRMLLYIDEFEDLDSWKHWNIIYIHQQK